MLCFHLKNDAINAYKQTFYIQFQRGHRPAEIRDF